MGRICLKLPPSEHHGFKFLPFLVSNHLCSSGLNPLLCQLWTVHLQGAVHRQKSLADARRSATPHFHPGQMVWLSTRDIHLRQPYWQLNARIIGPHRLPNKSYHLPLDLPWQYRILPFTPQTFTNPFPLPSTGYGPGAAPTPSINTDEQIYRVASILDSTSLCLNCSSFLSYTFKSGSDILYT